ncbi:MAG: hypothetical protein U5M23_04820 [Marinagarivorans sp.]|nr:hypothetical protein [Marinagarivorans sp.]
MKTLFLTALLFTPSLAIASHNCSGVVNNLDIANGGILHVNIAGVGDGNILCSIETKKGLYSPESCKALFSMAMAAKMSGKNLRLYFQNDTDTSCAKGNWKDFTSSSYQLYFVRLEG